MLDSVIDLVPVTLPMPPGYRGRPRVQLVSKDPASGKYKNVPIVGGATRTEMIPSSALRWTDKYGETVYLVAAGGKDQFGRTLSLAVNPGKKPGHRADFARGNTSSHGFSSQKSKAAAAVAAAKNQLRQLLPKHPKLPEPPPLVSLLVVPVGPGRKKELLLNVPHREAVSAKLGTILAFPGDGGKKFKVVGNRMYMPVGVTNWPNIAKKPKGSLVQQKKAVPSTAAAKIKKIVRHLLPSGEIIGDPYYSKICSKWCLKFLHDLCCCVTCQGVFHSTCGGSYNSNMAIFKCKYCVVKEAEKERRDRARNRMKELLATKHT